MRNAVSSTVSSALRNTMWNPSLTACRAPFYFAHFYPIVSSILARETQTEAPNREPN